MGSPSVVPPFVFGVVVVIAAAAVVVVGMTVVVVTVIIVPVVGCGDGNHAQYPTIMFHRHLWPLFPQNEFLLGTSSTRLSLYFLINIITGLAIAIVVVFFIIIHSSMTTSRLPLFLKWWSPRRYSRSTRYGSIDDLGGSSIPRRLIGATVFTTNITRGDASAIII